MLDQSRYGLHEAIQGCLTSLGESRRSSFAQGRRFPLVSDRSVLHALKYLHDLARWYAAFPYDGDATFPEEEGEG